MTGRALLLLVVVVAGCSRASATPPGFQGVLEFDDRVISFEVPGRVRQVAVRRGDVVSEGAVLAMLDDTLEQLTLKARKDDLAAAQADLALLEAGSRREDVSALAADVRAARTQEDLAAKNAERARNLSQTGAIGQAELDSAQADLERTTQQRRSLEQKLRALQEGARPQELERARARVESAAAAVSLEDERLVRHTLLAKVAGEVVDVTVEPGELAAVGTPAVTLADVRHPYVDVFVPQADLDGIQLGTRGQLRVDATPDAFPGVVEYVSPETEFTPRFLFSEQERPHLVVRVRVRVDDPAQRLHAGVPAFVRFER
jgi:HlyD family secretion protein